jgi:protein involved in polysaccharide export with SLBB domain
MVLAIKNLTTGELAETKSGANDTIHVAIGDQVSFYIYDWHPNQSFSLQKIIPPSKEWVVFWEGTTDMYGNSSGTTMTISEVPAEQWIRAANVTITPVLVMVPRTVTPPPTQGIKPLPALMITTAFITSIINVFKRLKKKT